MSEETRRDETRWIEWLQALELAQVAITASIDPAGQLGPIGGLWPKLLAAAQDAATLGLLRIVVVAEEQSDVAPELLVPEASPLRVVKAASLWEAVRLLNEEYGPREAVRRYEREQSATLNLLDASAPLVTCYQVLPLLQEVKRERLLQTEQERHEELESQDEHGGFREVDIVRWEEEVRQERVTYERVPVEQLFSNFYSIKQKASDPIPRCVVLGPPGSGKTTLTQYLSWQAAQQRLSGAGRPLIPARIRLREWEAWTTKEEVPEQSLPQYLTERYKGLSPAPRPAQWRHWLQHGEVLLLLDGLDEIEGSPFFLTALKTALLTLKACPIVLTCRTVSFEQHRAVCPDFPLFTLAGFDTAQRDAYIRAFPAEHRGDYDPERLITHLNRTPQMSPLTTNPLLLNIICYVVDDASGLLSATRGMLYKLALEKLLTHRPQRVKIRYPGEEPTLEDQLAVLERIALDLFTKGDQRLTFTGEDLGRVLKRALSEEGYGDAPAPWANALRVDLIENSGILRGSPSQGFFFLHLTIQEFLAAAAIARLVNEQGWDALVEIPDTRVSVRRLVDSKAWDPRWQEVIILLAGQLHDPLPLLRLLADERNDDLFRWRLALAALCLPEAQLIYSDHRGAIIDRIVTDTFSFWFEHEQNGSSAAISHVARALPALGQVHGHIKGVPLFQWLCQRLHDSSAEARVGVVEALGQLGQSIDQHPNVLLALLQATREDRDEVVRARAVETLGRIRGKTARRSEVLSALLQTALHDVDWFVRSRAAKALGQLEIGSVERDELLSALRTALYDENLHVRLHAAEAFGQLDEQSCQHAVTVQQQQAPQKKNASLSPEAAGTIPQVDETAVQPLEPHTLIQALSDKDSVVRRGAARALGQREEAAPPSHKVLIALSQTLYDKDAGVRSEAAKALGQIKEALMSHPPVLSTLIEVALHDKDGGVRAEIAATFGRVGATIARSPSVLLALVRLVLHDTDRGVRARAARSLGEIGETAAYYPEVTAALTQAIHDEDSEVRFRAAEALGRLMAQGVRLFRRRWGKVKGKSIENLYTLSSKVYR